jgi:cardiolipin synthase A/B
MRCAQRGVAEEAMMSNVSVVIPVLRGRTIFVVDKGRPWSIVEHLVLEALTIKEWTAGEMASAANISRRVVVEAYIRLMRAGWVELSHSGGAVTFRANSRGATAAKYVELPAILERKTKPINFIVDLVVGEVYRNHEWSLQQEHALRQRSKKEAFVWIEPKSIRTTLEGDELIDVLLDDDETFVNAEPSGLSRRRFVVVYVKDGIIEGLPAGRELPELRKAILDAAAQNPMPTKDASTVFEVPGPQSRVKSAVPQCWDVDFKTEDLILDGKAHRDLITSVFSEAHSRIFIHSTFIDEQRFLAFLPNIEKSIQRGVHVHVFWGQNEEKDKVVSTQAAVARLRNNPLVARLKDMLIFHPFSTGSHAKLIVADAGGNGEYIAVVGSCNWLTSNFLSYEASVVLRDPRIVREVVKYLSQLSCIHDGVWSNLASELVGICQSLQVVGASSGTNARASIVIGAQHNHFVLRARDEALTRIFVASHRLGPVSGPSVIVPLMVAAEERGIEATVYYCRTVAPLWVKTEEQLVGTAARAGVSVAAVESPRLHAKVLVWDADSILVTSLNWLSADPIELDSLKEIGVWIGSKDVGTVLVDNFASAATKGC